MQKIFRVLFLCMAFSCQAAIGMEVYPSEADLLLNMSQQMLYAALQDNKKVEPLKSKNHTPKSKRIAQSRPLKQTAPTPLQCTNCGKALDPCPHFPACKKIFFYTETISGRLSPFKGLGCHLRKKHGDLACPLDSCAYIPTQPKHLRRHLRGTGNHPATLQRLYTLALKYHQKTCISSSK